MLCSKRFTVANLECGLIEVMCLSLSLNGSVFARKGVASMGECGFVGVSWLNWEIMFSLRKLSHS